ncbi:rho gtpase activation protein [Anaeramoeba flamelloides]|uniref:Rho gtpase activation protein n=1 Tax=Anaeramoeba flamelloides TaxID=1746091 RepID=A0AAV7YG02_9EUKA|nr:rho gtpase activation protein [Anaeramoeba flamelloides]
MNHKHVDFWYELWDEEYQLPYYYHTDTEQSTWIKPRTGFFISVVDTMKNFDKEKTLENLQDLVKSLPTAYYQTKKNELNDYEFLEKYKRIKMSQLKLEQERLEKEKQEKERKKQIQKEKEREIEKQEKVKELKIKKEKGRGRGRGRGIGRGIGRGRGRGIGLRKAQSAHIIGHKLQLGGLGGFGGRGGSTAGATLLDVEIEGENTNEEELEGHNTFRAKDGYKHQISGTLEKKAVVVKKPVNLKEAHALPKKLQKDIQKFSLQGFAEKHFQTAKKGRFNKKRIPLDKRMNYQNTPISTSLLRLPKAIHCKTAIKLFKNLLVYMGEISARNATDLKAISGILSTGVKTPELRDEIYIQVIKQTTNNPNKESEIKAWCALSLLAHSFIPTRNLHNFVKEYCNKNTSSKNEQIQQFAKYITRILRSTSEKSTFLLPSPPLIKSIMDQPFLPVVYGISLDELLENEKKEGSTTPIPKVLPYLYENIEKNGGFQTQGIFRVPGNSTRVKSSKVEINNGTFNNRIKSPSVYASLLKLFFREMDPPIIPYERYPNFVSNNKDWKNLQMQINRLPKNNLYSFASLIQFCQKLTQPENVKVTQMNIDNVAMVFAPNLLRKPDLGGQIITSADTAAKLTLILILKNWKPSQILKDIEN